MSFSRNTILSAVFALSSLAMVAQDAQACPPRGGFSRGYSSSYSYRRPSYSRYTPTYNQPYSHVVRPVQPVVSQPVAQPPVQQIPLQQAPVQQVPVQQAPVQQQFPVQQQTPIQQVSQGQPLAPQQVQTQPVQQPLRPVTQQPVAPSVQQPVVPQTQQPAAPQTNPAAMSALQALGGFAPPQQAPAAPQPTAPQVSAPVHVGNWTATLGNGASVRLTLQNDGAFVWVATNQNGNASSFSGRYSVSNGSLTLNRSNDNQQLGGSMTISGTNAFRFKVAGNNAAEISFTRS